MSSARILVVDDQPDVCGLAALMLRKAGHEVNTVGSGAAALAQIAEIQYDIVLLDINMPGMDGWEVLKILKSDPATADLPVAMFSVRGEVRDKVHGMQGGAIDYITKPFAYEEITNRVASILRKASGQGQREQTR
jgi:two-component system OmpR family response regulator